MRILHVTEAMGGGVLNLVQTLSRRQIEQGAQVSVWFAARPETPDDEALNLLFDNGVDLIRHGADASVLRGHLALMGAVRRASSNSSFDVIHIHSSKAGAYGRLAAWFRRRRSAVIVYSPHGFAFLREDTSNVTRYATWLAEALLARMCDAIVLTAASERNLAQRLGGTTPTYLLRTGVPAECLRSAVSMGAEVSGRRLRVGMVGRVCYQKAPWRFARAARALDHRAEFVWIGGGDESDIARWLGDYREKVTGWLNAEELAKQINELDVILFPTLWEGMALSLMQAQAQGVPAVVSDVVGNVDTVVDGVTGFVCRTDEEIINSLDLLLSDDDLRRKMAGAAVQWAEEALLDTDLGTDSITIYRTVSDLQKVS